MKKKQTNPYLIDDENPEWTEEDFRRARPAREVLAELMGKEKAEEFLAANRAHIAASKRGRPPKVNPKISTTLRLDENVLREFRATGRGWQSRINDALKEWLREHSNQ